ncbi:hypothetical protein [Streptomyces sp. 2224.1]|uniref:hypothetical protein n=1 Tax=Streptomyces sp. 2224.1 TaxID=1881020 RepID=UPI0011607358|nr:hypothetical protein [Streptomyces sp. 2224.1]
MTSISTDGCLACRAHRQCSRALHQPNLHPRFLSEPLAYIRARAGQLGRRSGRREPGLACTHRRRLRKLTLQVILRWLVHTPSNSTDLWKMVDEAVDDTDRGRTVGDPCVPSLRPRHLAGFHQTSRSERRQSFSKD